MSRSPLRRALLGLCFGVVVSGCSSEPTDPPDGGLLCPYPFYGDKTKTPEIELTARGVDGVSRVVKDGDEVAMIFPPQGGRVIFAGVRATNIASCGVTLSGAVRDLTTKQLRLDARTVNLSPLADAAGYGGSDDEDLSTFANVPVCPNQWSVTDLYGHEYEMSIAVTDRDKRTATKTAKVIPTCAEPMNLDECLCICKGGYMLGEMCVPPMDAGADAAPMDAGADAAPTDGGP